MKINETIGIDVSKKSIDVFIHSSKRHKVFKNSQSGFSAMMQWISSDSVLNEPEQLFWTHRAVLLTFGEVPVREPALLCNDSRSGAKEIIGTGTGERR